MSGGKFDFKEIRQFQNQIEQLDKDRDKLYEDCAKYLAARLLAKVKKRTPVGQYDKPVTFTTPAGKKVHFTTKSGKEVDFVTKNPKTITFTPKTGKQGGVLRAGWTAGEVVKTDEGYSIEIVNPTEYASYVEYGHRTANHKGWVPGQFMLTISERELEEQAPKMIEKKISDYLKGAFHV